MRSRPSPAHRGQAHEGRDLHPHHGGVHADYAFCLTKLIMQTMRTSMVFNGVPTTPEIELFMQRSSTLPTLRNLLVRDALDWDANYLLWVDSDHNFPPDALVRLLSLNRPVVGVNYPRRTYPTCPTAVALDGERMVWTTEELARAGTVERVLSVGLGFCLIDTTIFHRLHAHVQTLGRQSIWPLFAFEPGPDQIRTIGGDVFFFRLLAQAGIEVYLDHPLSWSIGHARERMVTNRDALAEREAFEAQSGRTADP